MIEAVSPNERRQNLISSNQIHDVLGQPVYGSDGGKIGKVGQVYLDDVTGKPEWVTVQTGMFGTKESFVPVAESQFSDGSLRVPYDQETVKDAPRVNADQGHLTQEEEADLYQHYGLNYSEDESDSGLPDGQADSGPVQTTSGLSADEAMTRSEEQLKVGTQQVETGRARLRKYVVTEERTVTVPVSREEVRVEREPITEANRDKAMDGPGISEEEHEVTLSEERVVVQKETVPVERVKLTKDTVTEQQQVTEEVRKEQIETEDDITGDHDAARQGDDRA